MRNKKSQIQIGETIAVLFVFFILIVVGFVFYARVIKGNIEVEREELAQLRTVGIAQAVMFMPELQCSNNNIIIDNCIDIMKLNAARAIIESNQLHYFDLLSFGEIDISEVYPGQGKWTLYSRKIDDYSSRFYTNVPVSLYNPQTKKYSFGVLAIETLSR